MDGKNKLYARLLAPALQAALSDTPVVCLLGSRQSGKTTLCRMLSPDRPLISLDEEAYFQTAKLDPDGFVNSLPDAVTLDEIQRVPELLPAIKLAVDRQRTPGRFLLTGSANLLLLPQVTESLAGRMETVFLHPLTEAEKERSPGTFLKCFLEKSFQPAISGGQPVGHPSLAERLVAGGYPEPLTRPPQRARQWHRQYLHSIMERDIKDVARVKDAHELARLLELLALRSAELLNVNNLTQDLGLYRGTIEQYLLILERLFLIRRLPSWHGNLSKRLIKAPKIHLVDSGLAATLATLTADDWIEKRDRMGHLLESFVIQQIIAQASWTDPDLRFWHYRDKDQIETDLVITRGQNVWGIEVKASASVNPQDGKGLARLAGQCGKKFQSGILLYGGKDILPLGNTSFLAVPFSKLWDM
ncbi:MAG: ATP-binding protein [Kiritimatiellales bacterium]|nr:ATP-binding protein [Kiritimatiellales bacterium]